LAGIGGDGRGRRRDKQVSRNGGGERAKSYGHDESFEFSVWNKVNISLVDMVRLLARWL
jgi:hypothetical protein